MLIKTRAFSLIELLVVVAIIAVLAAIAFPTYQTYSTRAQVAAVISGIQSSLVAFEKTFETTGTFANSSFTIGTSTFTTLSAGNPGFVSISGLTGVTSLNYYVSPDNKGISGYFTMTNTAFGSNNRFWFGLRDYNGVAMKTYCGWNGGPNNGTPTYDSGPLPGILPSTCTCNNVGYNWPDLNGFANGGICSSNTAQSVRQ